MPLRNMRGSTKFCQREFNTDNVIFLLFSRFLWREDRKATKSGQSSAHQRNAIAMAFRWRADNGPPFNAGLVAL